MSEHTSIEVDVTATDEVADPWARTRGGLYVPAAPRRTLRAVDLWTTPLLMAAHGTAAAVRDGTKTVTRCPHPTGAGNCGCEPGCGCPR